MAETYVTLSSLKHYDEKIKEVIDEKQDQLVGTEGQVVSFDADGNVIAVDAPNGGGEEPLVVDFRYKSNGEGYEAYDFTHTNAEIIDAINNGRTVIIKGLINTARDYAPYIFQLHTYMKNSGRYEFVYSTFSNYMEITEYKLIVYNNDNLDFLVNTYKVNQTIPEIPYGDEGQFISFDEEGYLIAVDAPTGGEEPTLVSFVYESTDNNTWTVHSVDKTYDEIKTALSENKRVIAKGTNKNARLDNPWYFYPNEYYNSAGNWVVFERVNVNGSSAIEAFKLTVNGDGTATLVETEVSQIDLSNYVEKEEGKGLSTNDLTDELLETIETGDAKTVNGHTVESNVPENAKFTDTVTTVTTTGSGNAITSISSTDGVVTATKGSTFLTAHPTISKSTDTTSTATATHGGTITMVDSVTRDGNGHVTKINTKTVTLPSDADTKYTHPTTSGNKHIPSGGSSGQILRWSADGTAVWGADNNTTYSNFVKSGSGAKAGLVPAPSTTAGTTKYLREDGTWQVPPTSSTTLSTLGITATTDELNYTDGVTSNIQTQLNAKAPTSHASTATTYGKGSTSNYGHLKINDSYSSTPSTSYNASNGVAASLYAVQNCYKNLNDRCTTLGKRIGVLDDNYVLAGTISFGIGTQNVVVSTAISKNDVVYSPPFSTATNSGAGYFTTSTTCAYYYKFVRSNSSYTMNLIDGAVAPTSSTDPSYGGIMKSNYIVNKESDLDTVSFGSLTFKPGVYYYGACSSVTTANRGGVLYLYTKVTN